MSYVYDMIFFQYLKTEVEFERLESKDLLNLTNIYIYIAFYVLFFNSLPTL